MEMWNFWVGSLPYENIAHYLFDSKVLLTNKIDNRKY